MSGARVVAIGCVVLALGGWPQRVGATEQCHGVHVPASAVVEPAVIHVGPRLGLLCMAGAELRAVSGYGPPLALTCAATCAVAGEVAAGLYRLDDAGGAALRVVRHDGGADTGLADMLRGDAKIRAARPIVLGAREDLVEHPERGGCTGLPDGRALAPGREYVAASATEASLLVIDGDGATAALASPDDLVVERHDFVRVPERTYAGLRVAPSRDAPDARYRWRVLEGEQEIIAPTISGPPGFVAFPEGEPTEPGALVVGTSYILEIERIDREARRSAPARHALQPRETRGACVDMLDVFGGVVASVVLAVVLIRRRLRGGRR